MQHYKENEAPRFVSVIEKANAQQGDWFDILDERQLKELEFSNLYEQDFHHGTTGHNQLMLIATLSKFITFIFDHYELKLKGK